MMRRVLNQLGMAALALGLVVGGCGGGGGGDETPDTLNDGLLDLGPAEVHLDGVLDIQVPCETDTECENAFPCRTGTCEAGWCQLVNKTGSCDDKNACTLDDQCADGECLGVPKQCDDGKYCNGNELCDEKSGECTVGVAPVLDDEVECTVDECDEEADLVVHLPDNAACAVDGVCSVGVCDSASGCVVEIKEGTGCDDGNKCTTGDVCDAAGTCVGSAKVCDDGLFCNGVESCQASSGECKTAETKVDDGLECTTDACDEELDVVTHTPDHTKCADPNPCTDDLCDLTQGCVNPWREGECSDNNDCTVGDHCDSGMCVPGEAICFPEVCDNQEDDDDDGMTDCDDLQDCQLDWACLPSGENCLDAVNLGLGQALDMGEEFFLYLTTAGKTNDFESSCVPFSGGADVVHLVTVTQKGLLNVKVTPDGSQRPAIAALPGTCVGEMACVLGETNTDTMLVLPVVPGGYYLVVDGAGAGDQGAYTIKVWLTEPVTTETVCNDNVDQDEDGLTDCFDLDCLGSVACGEPTGDACDSPLPLFETKIGASLLPVQSTVEGDTSTMFDDLGGSCDPDTGANKDMVYFFQLESPAILDAQLTFLFEFYDLYPALYLLDWKCGEGTELACKDTMGAPAVVHRLMGPGTYYLVVDAAFPSDAGPFRLDVKLDPPPTTETDCMDKQDQDFDGKTDCVDSDCAADPFCVGFEGDTCASPYLVNAGAPVGSDLAGQSLVYTGSTIEMNDQYSGACAEGSVGSNDAVYRMEVETPVTIKIKHDYPSFVFPAVYVFKDSCGAPSDAYLCDGDEDLAVVEGAFAPGTYYIVVDASYTGDDAPYTLTLDFSAPPEFETYCWDQLDDDGDGATDCADIDCEADLYCLDPYEPNNEQALAFPMVPADGAYTVMGGTAVSPVTDSDWFAVQVQGKGFLTVTVDPVNELNVQLELRDQLGTVVASSNTAGAGAAESILFGYGTSTTLYLVVTSYSSTEGTYELTLSTSVAAGNETSCDDGIDNNLNGATDCDDAECEQEFYCLGESCSNPKVLNGGVAFTYLDAGVVMHYEGTTADNKDDLEGACDDSTAEALDEVYQFSLDSTLRVSISMDFKVLALYPAVYLFKGGCDAANEVACAYTVGTGGPARLNDKLLEAGTYYIVVDAADAVDAGDYTLEILLGLPTSTESNCADGIDNDGDFYPDCCDSDCEGNVACDAETNCGDGKDNDCDLYSDCYDTDCATNFACMGENCASPKPMNNGQPIGVADAGLILTYQATTANSKPDYKSVNCDALATNAARDDVWTFQLTSPMRVSISHDFTSTNRFPAVYLYSGQCLAANELACDSEKSSGAAIIPAVILQPGTYFVVVDAAYSTDSGAYTLVASFEALVATETDCANGLDDDGDLAVDCCDTECVGTLLCYESDCADQLDNDCNGVADCDDATCNGSVACNGQVLPFSENFELLGNGPELPDGWTQTAPNLLCKWIKYVDPIFGGHYLYIKEAMGCSTTATYRVYSPLLDLEECETVGIQFAQKSDYANLTYLHEVGVWSGTGEVKMVLPPATANITTTDVLQFNTTGMTQARFFFGYRGDDADRWYVDNILVWCTSLFTYEDNCFDGKDQDKDGLIDCCDPDCSTNPGCMEDCTDGVDNDCDNSIDCCDANCATHPTCLENCSDGKDNDCDTQVDCCDSNCATQPICAEDCNDGLDNDCDQVVDCCDTSCGLSPYCVEVCNDLTDNDCDTKADCLDPGCVAFPACIPEVCNNGIDDNSDGKKDCQDTEKCALHPFCTDADSDGVSDQDDVCSDGDDKVNADLDLFPDACEIGWVGQVWPNGDTAVVAGASVDVYVQVWKAGVTDQTGQGQKIVVTLKYKNQPEGAWKSVPAIYNVDVGNNDEYVGTVPAGYTISGTNLLIDVEVTYVPSLPSPLTYLYNQGPVQDQSSKTLPLTYTVN